MTSLSSLYTVVSRLMNVGQPEESNILSNPSFSTLLLSSKIANEKTEEAKPINQTQIQMQMKGEPLVKMEIKEMFDITFENEV